MVTAFFGFLPSKAWISVDTAHGRVAARRPAIGGGHAAGRGSIRTQPDARASPCHRKMRLRRRWPPG